MPICIEQPTAISFVCHRNSGLEEKQEDQNHANMITLRFTSHLNVFSHFQSSSLSSVSVSHRTHFQSLVLSAKRRKKRNGYGGIARFLIKSLSLQILPQPLDLVIGGDEGGGLEFWRGCWRRRRNRVPIMFLVSVILWFCGYCKVSGREMKSLFKVFGVCLFGLSMVKDLKRVARVVFFGVVCFVAAMVLGFKKESFVKLSSGIRSYSSVLVCNKNSRTRVRKN